MGPTFWMIGVPQCNLLKILLRFTYLPDPLNIQMRGWLLLASVLVVDQHASTRTHVFVIHELWECKISHFLQK